MTRSTRRATGALTRHLDVALAVAVVAIFGAMIVPLPPVVLDVAIAANLGLAAVLLTLSLQVSDALQISAFPSLLLLTTLFRLGLEISATRLVLLRAYAGQVIHAFGSFVVGGSLVVGLVVFLILTLVQYLVISKGAERVAEVAARFTLDAMPGKQMAIDAELRGGFIDAAAARARRGALARESQLFGSMDGAMKFVKGDAIAGLVILAINLVGGLAIGIFEHGLPVADALRIYAVLTIGGGLAAQIPAIVISTAAGIVVTRVASEGEGASSRLGVELARQVGEHPKAIAVASGLLLALALVPGLPMWPFLLLSAVTAGLAWRQFGVAREREVAAAAARLAAPDFVVHGAVSVVIGAAAAVSAVSAVSEVSESAAAQGPRAASNPGIADGPRIAAATGEALRARLGLVLPNLTVEVVPGVSGISELEAGSFAIYLGASLRTTRRWQQPPVDAGEDHGGDRNQGGDGAVGAGAGAVGDGGLARRVAAVLGGLASELVSVRDTDAWLDAWQRFEPALLREVAARGLSLTRLTDLLRSLLREGVSLANAIPIFEALASRTAAPPVVGSAPAPRDSADTVEQVRGALGRGLVRGYLGSVAPAGDHPGRPAGPDGALRAIELEALIEDTIRDGVRMLGDERKLAIEPALSNDMIAAIARAVSGAPIPGPPPVVLTQRDIRRHVRTLIETALPDVPVLAFTELPPDLQIQFVGRARIAG